ncbi:hypothetical protein [Prochlorothrix hollandica]|uniref:hypothetical protein n=1 Tax=Prochlorothrix hollandica TaxID=1223 RepID=UPI000345EF03|nr:hypothetical protein [Prochlorothrix hollandica]
MAQALRSLNSEAAKTRSFTPCLSADRVPLGAGFCLKSFYLAFIYLNPPSCSPRSHQKRAILIQFGVDS